MSTDKPKSRDVKVKIKRTGRSKLLLAEPCCECEDPPRTIMELRRRLPKGWNAEWVDLNPVWDLWVGDVDGRSYYLQHDVGSKDPALYPGALAIAEALEASK